MTNLKTEKVIHITLPEGKVKERIDVFLTQAVENATRSRIQKLIDAELVIVNGKPVKSNYKVNPCDEIIVTIPITPRPENIEAEEIPLDIMYEDEYLLIVNKPPGMVAHPAFSNYTGTLVNALLHHTNELSGGSEPGRPGIVHRIDKETSGLLVVAKDEYTHAKLSDQFAKHTTEREYWTVIWGHLNPPVGIIDRNIARSTSDRKKFAVSDTEGKRAVTLYEVAEEFEFTSLVRIKLKTGRTHQIRVHLASLGNPVFGDATYGGRVMRYGSQLPKMRSRLEHLLEIMPRQALHAKTLGFFHPMLKQNMRFDSELPEDFCILLSLLRTAQNNEDEQ